MDRIWQPPARLWKGELPPHIYRNPVFSCKIFLGGIPSDVTELVLVETFSKYGTCHVEWPSKKTSSPRAGIKSNQTTKAAGYVYMIFESESCVKKLIADCCEEFGSAGEWYFKLKLRRGQTNEIRQVQVIPWVILDAEYATDRDVRIDPKKTVFVGGLHGTLTAQSLYWIMAEVYGNALFVAIDTDKYKYPIGSGRVSFSSRTSYLRAVDSKFLEIRTSKFSKRVQVDPFLEEAKCSQCDSAEGPYFCRERSCFKYYCLQCWQVYVFLVDQKQLRFS
ncbi:Cytoplasmic polyadenylation element-binding protein 3 [Toxocara canis]|uniref:Cytoplasmic polyadenylation element-binding protein 3 n=1 Tax=Toxocara canis TaxID=6265 RepID=A0A0B2UVV7_TOXCA|nr:Cytoplasmic polyadenylation element-binding protein 3 [Toxocara canis]